ncbi:MAG: hypothetical protein P4L28_05950 [Paludibacteraceae bacterium]|nr:hypothetical protein [Paludibacteraceae bacterium]
MIEETIKIHDNFSLELKVGFIGNVHQPNNQFKVNTWFFVPNSLDINPSTYSKEQFYHDLRSNIRLITPIYTLQEIAEGTDSPIVAIEKAIKDLLEGNGKAPLKELEYQFKMFNSILKSSLREDEALIIQNYPSETGVKLIELYVEFVQIISTKFRLLEAALAQPKVSSQAHDFFLFSDEFMSVLIENHSFKLLHTLEQTFKVKKDDLPVLKLLQQIKEELKYKKKKGYLMVERDSADKNRSVILRRSVLKKYSESELFLNTEKKEDAFLIRQFVYSLAAGLSMIFATIVAFSFQMKYGSFTMPVFAALVVGYMLKDRIKELSRFYFAHKLGNKYFDLKTTISIGNDTLGICKESFDIIKNEKIPIEVMMERNRSALLEADNKFNQEQIMLYRMQVETNNNLLNEHNEYPVAGINNIIRLNLNSFLEKMDNPEVPLYHMGVGGNTYHYVKGEKVYFINMVLHLQHETQSEYKRYRIVFNRDGIKDVEKY